MTDPRKNSIEATVTNPKRKDDLYHSVHADLNMRIIQSLVWFVKDNYGAEKLNSISFKAGISPEKLGACNGWISLEQTESIMKQVNSLVGNDQAFMKACVHRMKESYGPLRFLLWATSPLQMLEMGQNHFSAISTFSSGNFDRITNNKYRLRYYSTQKESRLMCLSRQAQSKALPSLWDLPKANLKEVSCICRGDSCCEYELSVYEKSRFLPILGGGLLGLAVSGITMLLRIDSLLLSTYLWGVIPIAGALAGYIFELRRTNSHNLQVADDINRGLSQIVVENQEVQHEIMNLHERQRNWNRRLENQVAERTCTSEQLTKRLQLILSEQTSTLQGVSHDMKNPLTIILQTSEIILDHLSPENRWMAEEQKMAVSRIRMLLDDMLQIETDNLKEMRFLPEPVETKPLEDSLRRRLRALTGDLGLRLSVLATRETPECIQVDRVLLDRVIDNLITNAVKYTEQGSIVLELDGKPGFLTIKISDTGRGIADEDIERIFHAGGSDPDKREEYSHGLGLSVVVRLLDRMGGKLEVMSFPGRGSTFWVHFPIEPLEMNSVSRASEIEFSDPVNRVVTIRRVV
ncbi:MAG: HAMP domain-containing histidine kinase [Candidatus Sabulitectum sp.]|nr:HAMP domain-containing histidine kinase [Candidatus Sabulitectum sp.]